MHRRQSAPGDGPRPRSAPTAAKRAVCSSGPLPRQAWSAARIPHDYRHEPRKRVTVAIVLLYPSRVRWLLLVGATITLLSGAVAEARAQSRFPVAVLPFAGPGGTAARRTAIAVLETEPRVTVTDEGIADAAAERTGAGPSGAQGVEGFARQIQVRLVIQGVLTGRGARRRLALTARDATGRDVATQSTRMRGGAAGRRAIAQALDALLDTALASLPADRPRERSVIEEPPPPPPPPPTEPASFGDDPAVLAILVTAGLRARDTTIHLDDGSVRTYDASPYFELGARVELRPLAHERSYARGVYVHADVGGAVALSSRRADGTSVPTSFYRLGASVGYLIPIGDVVEVGPGIGAGFDAFQLADNATVPTIEYPYLRPALRGRFRLMGETIVLGIEGGFRVLFGREGLSSAFGSRGDSFGWDLGGGLSGTFDFGLTYSVEAGFTQYQHSFDSASAGFIGQGVSGTDGGYRFLVGLGYAIR
jgi:hypothetical protein